MINSFASSQTGMNRFLLRSSIRLSVSLFAHLQLISGREKICNSSRTFDLIINIICDLCCESKICLVWTSGSTSSFSVPVDSVSDQAKFFRLFSDTTFFSIRNSSAGKRVIAESVKILENLKWGVAVRDEEKMREVLKEIAKKCGQDLSDVPILSADATDESSLRKMALRAKVRASCFGCSRTFLASFSFSLRR